MSDEQRDADAVRKSDCRAIALLRFAVELRDEKDRSDIMDWFDGEDEFTQDDAIRAALRELNRLTAERDAARAEAERLRAAVNTLVREFEGVPEEFERMHARANRDGLYPNGTVYSMYAEKTAAALRAALGTEADHE